MGKHMTMINSLRTLGMNTAELPEEDLGKLQRKDRAWPTISRGVAETGVFATFFNLIFPNLHIYIWRWRNMRLKATANSLLLIFLCTFSICRTSFRRSSWSFFRSCPKNSDVSDLTCCFRLRAESAGSKKGLGFIPIDCTMGHKADMQAFGTDILS